MPHLLHLDAEVDDGASGTAESCDVDLRERESVEIKIHGVSSVSTLSLAVGAG